MEEVYEEFPCSVQSLIGMSLLREYEKFTLTSLAVFSLSGCSSVQSGEPKVCVWRGEMLGQNVATEQGENLVLGQNMGA